MELVENGSLDKVLHQHSGQVSVKVKVAMCAQICQAMCQLAKENVLHRDLAARNVLVQSLDPPCVKVGVLTGVIVEQQPSSIDALYILSVILEWGSEMVYCGPSWCQHSKCISCDQIIMSTSRITQEERD